VSRRRVRVLAVGGSTRPGSSTEKALQVCAAAAGSAGAQVELVAGRSLILPIYDTETSERSAEALALVEALRRADAVVIASPGYHGGMSGMIKNALDYVEDLRGDPRPYLDGMPVGCIAVAHGWQATVSTLHNLRVTVHALRGWPSPLGAAINAAGHPFAEDGTCLDETVRFQLETVAAQVVEFATWRQSARAAD
jgi:FMN reductase